MTLDELKTQLKNEIAEIEQAKTGLDAALLKKAAALTVVESTIAAAADVGESADQPEEATSEPEGESTEETETETAGVE